MQKLFVYADFDWLDTPELIGELSCDSVRGSETYGFAFDKEWLKNHDGLFLSEDLQNYTGMQYTQPGTEIFSCFSDALPDRWGRTLLNRREQIAATDEKRAVRRLTSFDYLTGIDDYSRMGGFRFAESIGGRFINADESLKVPPLSTVREMMHAAHEIEASEEKHILPEKKWLGTLPGIRHEPHSFGTPKSAHQPHDLRVESRHSEGILRRIYDTERASRGNHKRGQGRHEKLAVGSLKNGYSPTRVTFVFPQNKSKYNVRVMSYKVCLSAPHN